jgi:hypothetical protein
MLQLPGFDHRRLVFVNPSILSPGMILLFVHSYGLSWARLWVVRYCFGFRPGGFLSPPIIKALSFTQFFDFLFANFFCHFNISFLASNSG